MLLTRNVITGSAMAFRSKVKDLVGLPPSVPTWMLHDNWIALMIATVAGLAFIDKPLVKYRRHMNQQMGLTPPVKTDASRWVMARRRVNAYPIDTSLLESIYEKLSSGGNAAKYGRQISELEARIAHARVCANSPNKKFISRTLCVFKEPFTFRYHLSRHPDSNALYDAAKDLLPYKILFLKSHIANALARSLQRRKSITLSASEEASSSKQSEKRSSASVK